MQSRVYVRKKELLRAISYDALQRSVTKDGVMFSQINTTKLERVELNDRRESPYAEGEKERYRQYE